MRMRLQPNWIAVSVLLGVIAAAVLIAPAIAQAPGDPDADPEVLARQERFSKISADIHAETGLPEASALGPKPCAGGKAGPYPCSNVDLLYFMPIGSIGGGVANEVWGWSDRASGDEYAIVGRSTGTSFIDISDPTSPVYLGNLPTHSGVSDWRDIKVYRNFLYVVSEASGHGLQVFDLRHLLEVKNPPVTFSEDAHYSGFGTAHNIVINEDSSFAYIVGSNSCGWGLHILDLSVPKQPSFENCYSGDGYVHDAQCVIYHGLDANYNGSEICFAFNEDTLTIIDVTNKKNMVMLARRSYPNVQYTHQGWLSEDHAYLLLGDEEDETAYGHNTRTRIWRLDNLRAPELLGSQDGPGRSTDHNMYVVNNQLYESNYTSGLQMFSLSKLSQVRLPLIGYFDTYLASDGTEYKGSWSNYPYHKSGAVLVSSINEGLFILKPWPDMLVSPKPFSQQVKAGETVSADLLITNRGIGTLNWTVFTDRADSPSPCQSPQPVAWLQPQETDGRAVPGKIRPVSIVMAPGDLSPGRYDAYLCVGGDDPDKPLVDVQVRMYVVGEINIYLPDVGRAP